MTQNVTCKNVIQSHSQAFTEWPGNETTVCSQPSIHSIPMSLQSEGSGLGMRLFSMSLLVPQAIHTSTKSAEEYEPQLLRGGG